jgi:hypothetical protein
VYRLQPGDAEPAYDEGFEEENYHRGSASKDIHTDSMRWPKELEFLLLAYRMGI